MGDSFQHFNMRAKNLSEQEYEQLRANMGKVGGGVDGHAPTLTVARKDGKHVIRGNEKLYPPPTKREYDSKWEETYATELVMRKHAGLIRNYWYHPFSMWLPGKVRYTPDFMIEYHYEPYGKEKRLLEIVDVKGWHKNIREAMTKIRIASAIFDCFTWKLVKKQKGGGWDEEEI